MLNHFASVSDVVLINAVGLMMDYFLCSIYSIQMTECSLKDNMCQFNHQSFYSVFQENQVFIPKDTGGAPAAGSWSP